MVRCVTLKKSGSNDFNRNYLVVILSSKFAFITLGKSEEVGWIVAQVTCSGTFFTTGQIHSCKGDYWQQAQSNTGDCSSYWWRYQWWSGTEESWCWFCYGNTFLSATLHVPLTMYLTRSLCYLCLEIQLAVLIVVHETLYWSDQIYPLLVSVSITFIKTCKYLNWVVEFDIFIVL